jgi:hypothetical protein
MTLKTKAYDPTVATKDTKDNQPIRIDSFQPEAPHQTAKRRLSSPSAGPGPSSKAARRSMSPSRKPASEEVGESGKKKCFDYHGKLTM